MSPTLLTVSPEVAVALRDGGPVMALESTLIAQGLPWPANFETAREAEAIARQAGVTPATVAVIGGELRVGLSEAELADLARSGRYVKASRRDLATAVTRRWDAATTVAATLWIARSAGIGVMATGGLGGVHRGASDTFDVSADLDELARANGSLVVCSGIKSILDMPATLETLETLGVVVAGYRTDTLPAFTTPSSGLPLELRLDSPQDVAALVQNHRMLGLPGALIVAQPVPAAHGVPQEEMEVALDSALRSAKEHGITGKAITPFLLNEIRRATAGRSVRANRALIVANTELAAQIAVELGHRKN